MGKEPTRLWEIITLDKLLKYKNSPAIIY